MERPIGVQSFTYREFSVEEIADALVDTDVSAIELCGVHVSPGDSAERVEAVTETLDGAGVDVCGFGVASVGSTNDVDPAVDLAVALGADYLSVDFDPGNAAIIDDLVVAAAEADLLLGIHNHGPGATYSTVEDVLGVVEGRHDCLGACVDTGHYFRSGESPDTAIPALGDRVHAVHVKDFVDEETEVVPGEGNLDVAGFLGLLDETNFDQPLVIEYEEDPENPTPAVETTVERLQDSF